MKQFTLSRQPADAILTKFYVHDDANSIIGSINVPNEAADDLEKHWRGPAPKPAAASGKQNPMIAAMAAAAKRHPLNKQAILRGC